MSTISSDRAVSMTSFAILFSLKNILRESGNFLKKNSVSLVKLFFSYHPANQIFTYHVFIFSPWMS